MNILSDKASKNRSIPYEKYFGEMYISEEEKEKRIALAREFEVIFLALFLMIENSVNDISWDMLEQTLYENYLYIVKRYMGITEVTSYIEELARNVSYDVVNATKNHLDDDWYTSIDRAVFDSENEANSVGEYNAYVEAIKSGKTKKTWITMRDKRVRHSHIDVDGVTIPIDYIFDVGDSQMLYPRDITYSASAKEIVNCRCNCKYT